MDLVTIRPTHFIPYVIAIGASISIGQESLCLPYGGFFCIKNDNISYQNTSFFFFISKIAYLASLSPNLIFVKPGIPTTILLHLRTGPQV